MAVYGLLGGTFDPIHLGHLALAEMAHEACALARVVFVPAGDPPHKPGTVMAPARDRLRMAELATADNPHFIVSAVEVERVGPSYTVETVAELRRIYPGLAWLLIVGSDALVEIPTWRDYGSLLSRIDVLAAARPGSPLELPSELRPWRDRIRFFHPPALDISSTMIRDRITHNLSLRYLVPEAVIAYVSERRLYLAAPAPATPEVAPGS